MHDDLAFMGGPETPYLAPPSVLSEAPPSVMQVYSLFSDVFFRSGSFSSSSPHCSVLCFYGTYTIVLENRTVPMRNSVRVVCSVWSSKHGVFFCIL